MPTLFLPGLITPREHPDLSAKLLGLVRNLNIWIKQVQVLNGPRREKTCLRAVANNKGADQPARPRSLISAVGSRFLESMISRLATSEISIF